MVMIYKHNCITLYTKQKTKLNNYIPLNFLAYYMYDTIRNHCIFYFCIRYKASECKKPIFILMSIYGVTDHGHSESSKPHSAHVQLLK